MSSFYLLEMSVQPGGARKALVWLLSSEAEVRAALTENFRFEDQTDTGSLYLVTTYGEEIQLTPYQNGQAGTSINVLPYLTIHLADYPPITFYPGGYFNDAAFNEGYVDETGDGYKDRVDQLINDEAAEVLAVEFDWARAGIPPLTPPVLQPGQRGTIWSSYLGYNLVLKYGPHDLEFGDEEDEEDEEDQNEDEDEGDDEE